MNKASYIILTSKHHDGVCLFDTITTNRKSNLDICKVFSDECKKQNIPFGFYYSWFEFDKPFSKKYFEDYCKTQLDELLKYGPNYMWFDGDWKITQKTIQKQIKDIVNQLKAKNILINDRIGKCNQEDASYRVFYDRYIPEHKLDKILSKIDRGEGTLGALVNDPTLHESLKSALGVNQRRKTMKTIIRSSIEKSSSTPTETNSNSSGSGNSSGRNGNE